MSRPPFKRKDEVTRETIVLALLYATLWSVFMYGILEWRG